MKLTSALLLGIALLTSAAAAEQSVPDPAQCFADFYGQPRIGVSPVNDLLVPHAQYTFTYVLIDGQGMPIPNYPPNLVELDFSDCTSSSTRPSDEIHPDAASTSDGVMEWRQNLTFGGADPCRPKVVVLGVIFYEFEDTADGGGLRSPDIDGDGFVALADLQAFQSAFVAGTPPWVGDVSQPFDDLVAMTDLVIFQQHFLASP